MKIRKLLALLLSVLLVAGMFAGCGAATMDNAGAKGDYYVEEPMAAPEAMPEMESDYLSDSVTSSSTTNGNSSSETGAAANAQNRKLIRTIYMDAETEDMDTLLSQIQVRINELGGYVENREVYNGSMYNSRRYRNASLTIRIPATQLDAFVDHVSQVSNITSNRESTEDVTLQYVAIESRIAALETEQARLLELLAQAENMEDLLTIESRLTDVRYELENISSQLRVFDNRIDYGTIYLSISEVVEYTEPEPESGWQRMGRGFVKSLKGLWTGIKEVAIFLVAALPYLVLIAAIPVVVVIIVRTAIRRKRKKSAAQKNTEE